MYEPDIDDKAVYGALSYYRSVGQFLFRKGYTVRSKQFYDEAVKTNPKDKQSRIGRAWVHARGLQFDSAMADVDYLMNLYPGDIYVKGLKTLFRYLETDFETSFVENIRYKEIRRRPRWFTRGATCCNNTIETSIGEAAGHPLRDYYDIIKTIAMKKAYDAHKGYQVKSRHKKKKKKKLEHTIIQEGTRRILHMPPPLPEEEEDPDCHGSIIESLNEKQIEEELYKPAVKYAYQPLQRCTDNIDNLMAEKYLNRMYHDKLFLKELKSSPMLDSPNIEGKLAIKALAKIGYKTIVHRQEIFRARKPFYSIKYLEGQVSTALVTRQQKDLEKQQVIIKQNVENLVDTLIQNREAGFTNECIHLADKIKTYIDKTPLKLLPKKEVFLRQMYETIGLSHLDVYRLQPDVGTFLHMQRIYFLMGKTLSRPSSKDSVIKNMKHGFHDVRQALRITEKRMRNASTPLEVVWLYYELSRYNIQIRKWDLSRVYARKCISFARALGNHVYTVIGSFQVAKTYVQQGRRNEAKNQLARTKEYVKPLKRPETEFFIDQSIKTVDDIELDETETSKIIQQREQQITKVIVKKEMKNQVALLFQKMSVIPSHRRMSIIPGVAPEKNVYNEKPFSMKRLMKERLSIKRNSPPPIESELTKISI